MMDLMSTLAHGFGMHDAALALVRVGTGTFFAISGYHKLFNAERHAGLVATLTKHKVPAVKFNQWWVPGWELVAGASLALGFLTAFSAAVLAIICIVACALEARSRVAEYKPIDKADALDDYLYLPEVLYLLLLGVSLLAGTGRYSVDAFLFPL
jgi:uncharacterized membrane protein YphA (DoxX/SURF4 family)